ncbi:helix-turn-helix transcriptional regulator [Streptomyces sp. SID3212]|uniref:helix-turn-helix domain-containing protein n=1 Tax=unclassified Streptomyces TaxID=2593676 RepID=UPI00136D79B6|nr:helix-turn-helix transcriptional regulator [Streptomyces sp. SID3212]MYV54625.1 helix-turn-helix domain-containing protein [Streptomyces sp. SID3212]
MPARSCPTARQVRLGTELRKLREAVGMSGGAAAAFLGGERSQISHIEAGRWGVSGERIRRLAAHYSSTDAQLIGALVAMASERGKGWWEQYRGALPPGLLDLSELEHHATSVRAVEMLAIPGIFQTEAYARAIFESGNPGIVDDDLEVRIEHRLARRRIFDVEAPPEFHVVVHEAALRMRYGSRQIVRAQLESLLEVCDWPRVTIRVIPFNIDAFIGSAQSMLYVGGPVPQLDTVHVDAVDEGVFLDAVPLLEKYRSLFGMVESVSLGAEDSRKFIHRLVEEM